MSLPVAAQWRPVLGYEGYYEVSDQGRVRSVTRTVPTSNGHFRTFTGCELVQTFSGHGRLGVGLFRDGLGTRFEVHVLVLSAFAGRRPPGMMACHNDGVCTNNVLSNLRWDTQTNNLLDVVKHGNHHWANKTHCPQGHPLVAPNLVPSALRRGNRRCLACSRAMSNAKYARETRRSYDIQAWADDHYARIMEAAS